MKRTLICLMLGLWSLVWLCPDSSAASGIDQTLPQVSPLSSLIFTESLRMSSEGLTAKPGQELFVEKSPFIGLFLGSLGWMGVLGVPLVYGWGNLYAGDLVGFTLIQTGGSLASINLLIQKKRLQDEYNNMSAAEKLAMVFTLGILAAAEAAAAAAPAVLMAVISTLGGLIAPIVFNASHQRKNVAKLSLSLSPAGAYVGFRY